MKTFQGIALVVAFAGCGESKSARKPIESVPLEAPVTGPAPASPQADPTDPTTPVVSNVVSEVPSAPGLPSAAKGPTGPLASKAECATLLDRYFDLTLAADARSIGAPPEAIAQAKAMARGEGDPCAEKHFTKKQYQCGIKAKTKDAFDACMQ
jgi:hypothetical protein